MDQLEGTTLEDHRFIAIRGSGAFPKECAITPDDAWFLGMMAGDGFYGPSQKTNYMCLTLDRELDQDLAARATAYLSRRGVLVGWSKKKGARGLSLQWCNRDFAAWFVDVANMERVTGADKKIPESVWRGTREVVAAFIQGLFDADGCATTKPSAVLVNISEHLARGAHILLQRLNILSSLRFDPTINHKSDRGIWRLEISGVSLGEYRRSIGFWSRRKQKRLPKK